MITPQRWQQVKELLGRALEMDSAQRTAYLEQASADDPTLRQEVERLLAVQDKAGTDFLNATTTHDGFAKRVLASDDRRIGQRLGPYQIVEAIGEGGMGTVYRAIRADDQFHKQVAIKLLHAGQDSAFIISRFRNERQILASLDHPNIARLLDGGTADEGVPYFMMELIEGQPIDAYCDHQRLSTTERLGIFLQVCGAVEYAHQRLIIHRDIKPGNILVTSGGVPKLLDFGIAKLLDPAGTIEDATWTMFRALTPSYASPEQIKGGPITTATDVYSLGVVLYELLTGHRPYHLPRGNPNEIARAVCETDPERPSTVVTKTAEPRDGRGLAEVTPSTVSAVRDGSPEKLRRRLHGDLDDIILMALRKEPEERYASVEQFAEDVRRHLQSLPVVASQGSVSYRASKFVTRHKAAILATAAVALTLLVGVVVTLREAQIARREAALAREQAAIAQTERLRAQRRFDDVRKLANSLIFEVHDSIADLPGSTPTRKLIMDRAVEYLDSLAKDSGGDSTLQRDLAWAYQRIGQVQGDTNQGNLGQSDAMLASINKAAALFEEVAKANPNTTIDQLNAAFGHRLLGTVSLQAEERQRQIAQALAITERLMKTDGTNPKVKSERSIELAVLGSLQDADGNATAAVESFRKSLAVKQDLLATNPDYPHAKQGVAMATGQVADELSMIGSRREALQLNSEATRLYESVLAQEKNNARARRELALLVWKRGEMQMRNGDFAAALANYRRTLTMVEPMEKQDPQNVMLRVDVGGASASIGKALVGLGNVNKGLPMIDRGIHLLEQELKADPFDAPTATAAAYVWKGETLFRLGKYPEAAAADRNAIRTLESPRGMPPDASAQSRLAAAYVKLGSVLESMGHGEEANAAYRKALQIAESLQGSTTPNPSAFYVLADAYFGLGELEKQSAQGSVSTAEEARQRWSNARAWYGKSQDMWRKITNPGAVNLQGFPCGNPRSVSDAIAKCDAALSKLLS